MEIKTRKIDNLTFSFVNEEEFEDIYDEIFKYKIYRFTADTAAPFILDCGAHIGVSVLYFKSLYPHAKIIAFEPNPDTFKLLELNIKQNHLRDVELVNAAISHTAGEIDFYICEPSASYLTWAGGFSVMKNAWYDPQSYQTIKVPAVKLSSYITRPVDMLKIDVEGVEEIVLEEIEGKLQVVKEIRMEFHGSRSNERNNIERVTSLLKRNGFRFLVRQHYEARVTGLAKLQQIVQMNIIRINQIRISQIRKTDPYFLYVGGSRSRSALWWYPLVFPPLWWVYVKRCVKEQGLVGSLIQQALEIRVVAHLRRMARSRLEQPTRP
jgi:FkbM family methyltransferase